MDRFDAAGYLISLPIHAGHLVGDYKRRHIAPDETHALAIGNLRLWLCGQIYVAELDVDGWQLCVSNGYCNTTAPETIAADILTQKGGIRTGAALLNLYPSET